MIVIDASAAVLGLLNDGEARAPLLTADGRLARVPGPRCTIRAVRR